MRDDLKMFVESVKDELEQRGEAIEGYLDVTFGTAEIAPQPMILDPVVFVRREMIKIHPTSRIDSFVKIEGGLGVEIGPFVHIASFAHLNIGGGELVLEEGSAVASGGKIITGSNLVEAYSCSAVAPASWQQIKKSKVVIGRNATLFTGAIVLPGVSLGEGACLAAGGVATKDIPPYEIWGGVPARKIGDRPRAERPNGK